MALPTRAPESAPIAPPISAPAPALRPPMTAPEAAPTPAPTSAPVAVLSGRPEGVSHPISTSTSPTATAVRLIVWYFIFQLLAFFLDKHNRADVTCNF